MMRLPGADIVAACTVVLLLGALVPATESLSTEECRELGFVSSVAKCSHCSVLLQHTNEPTLYDECKQCCVESLGDTDGEVSRTTYRRARFELDFRGLYPGSEIARFLSDYAPSFPTLVVQDTPRTFPRIVLIGEDGQIAETIRVQSWRCDLIVDFLQKMLETTK